MMRGIREQKISSIVLNLLDTKKENEYFDLKEKWHDKSEDLAKDIICLSNTVHDKDCYLIFGIDDNFEIVGVSKENRRKQSDVLDILEKLTFAGDSRPDIQVDTVRILGKEIDVLTIFNVNMTPIYLEQPYGKMHAGCIYSRLRDKNTPDYGNATFLQVKELWKKRFYLTKTKPDILLNLLSNKKDWNEIDSEFYHAYYPEYRIEIISDDEDYLRDRDEFYSYAMSNSRTSFNRIVLKWNETILDTYQGVVLDSGRLFTVCPTWSFVCYDQYQLNPKFSYKYYVKDSHEDILKNFFLDNGNHEATYAMNSLLEVVLLFESEKERKEFEGHIETNEVKLIKAINSIDRYSYYEQDNSENNLKMTSYVKQLHVGLALNAELNLWRNKL